MSESDNIDPASGAQRPDMQGGVRPATFSSLDESGGGQASQRDIELVLDVPVQVTVQLGRTRMEIRNLLGLAYGSVLGLDNAAGEPLDVLVNGCLVAQGEVVIVNDRYGVRLTDIVTPAERLKKLHR